MATYGFRLKFNLPPGRFFAGVKSRRRLQLDVVAGRVYLVRLRQQMRQRAGARTRHAIVGESFPTEEAARATGEKLRLALSCFAAEKRFGVDARDRRGVEFSDAVARAIARQGDQLRPDKYGLDVYSEDKPVERYGIEAYGKARLNITGYGERLAHFFGAHIAVTAKQQLALDLYNLTHFEGSQRTRFLTLITIVEVLADRTRRSAAVQDVLLAVRALAERADLPQEERRSLLSGIDNLRQQSIGEACRVYVRTVASEFDARYFKACYDVRSDLVHAGRTDSAEPDDPTRLDELVSLLLLRSIVRV
jgi:hypothetical protein